LLHLRRTSAAAEGHHRRQGRGSTAAEPLPWIFERLLLLQKDIMVIYNTALLLQKGIIDPRKGFCCCRRAFLTSPFHYAPGYYVFTFQAMVCGSL